MIIQEFSPVQKEKAEAKQDSTVINELSSAATTEASEPAVTSAPVAEEGTAPNTNEQGDIMVEGDFVLAEEVGNDDGEKPEDNPGSDVPM